MLSLLDRMSWWERTKFMTMVVLLAFNVALLSTEFFAALWAIWLCNAAILTLGIVVSYLVDKQRLATKKSVSAKRQE